MNSQEGLARAEQALQRGAPALAGEILFGLLAEAGDRPLAEIRMLLQRAGAAGHEESRLVLATMMLQGDGGAPAPPRALGILDELVTGARSEDVRAQAHAVLGDCHARGVGVEADETTAFHHYEQAAERGVPQCAFNIALAYDEGLFGRRIDIPTALVFYVRAAAAGHAQSMANIVLLYMSGKAELPLDDSVRSLLEGPLPAGDPGAAALIHSSRETLIQWAGEHPAPG